jgi:hypothetical protein
MKKFRFLPIIALLLAVGFSAFTFQNNKIKAQDPLWFYDEGSTAGHNTPGNYEPLIGQDEDALCPGVSSVRCVIEAPDSSGYPQLSVAIVRSFKP